MKNNCSREKHIVSRVLYPLNTPSLIIHIEKSFRLVILSLKKIHDLKN